MEVDFPQQFNFDAQQYLEHLKKVIRGKSQEFIVNISLGSPTIGKL